MAAQHVDQLLSSNGLNNGEGTEDHLTAGFLNQAGKGSILATINTGGQQTACLCQFGSANQDGLSQRPRKSEAVARQMKPGKLAVHERTLQVSPEIGGIDTNGGCRNE